MGNEGRRDRGVGYCMKVVGSKSKKIFGKSLNPPTYAPI